MQIIENILEIVLGIIVIGAAILCVIGFVYESIKFFKRVTLSIQK